ncbi:hypothetical protein CFP56_032394 [Quercus suber]|uniref:Uncharacterized protein n=1 Tax=Quercus suber TaxID=58331 RepID=A0AAW0JGW6_QUESU
MALSFERQNSNHVHGGGNDFCTENQSPQRDFIPTSIDLQEGETCAGLEVDETLGNKEEVIGICIEEYSSQSSQVNFNSKFNLVRTNFDGGDVLRNKDDEFHQARSYNSCNEKGRVVSNSGSSNHGSVAHPSDQDKDNDVLVPEESSFCNSPLEGKLDTTKEKAFSEQTSLCNIADEDGDVNPMGQRILISEREMIKETDEYKRAMEEERASRQQQLQIQAEEAQRLRKRRRDESEQEKHKETDEYKRAIEEEWASRLRQLQIQAEEAKRLRRRKRDERHLVDMQRRQKQRVEEVRKTQKKVQIKY